MSLAFCSPPMIGIAGPTSNVADNGFLRFDGTTGKKVQGCTNVGADDNGQVYIGSTSAGAMLDIIPRAADVVGLQIEAYSGQTANLFEVNSNGGSNGDLICMDKDGNMGIGVTGPCSLLELRKNDTHPVLSITAAHNTNYDPQIHFRTDVTDTVKFSVGVDAGDGDKFKIFSGEGIGGTSEFVIDGSGNIGIGTATPGVKLDISDSSTSWTLRLANTAADGDPRILFHIPGVRAWNMGINNGDWDKFMIGNDGGGTLDSNIRLTIDNDGNIGIGETAPETLVELTNAAPYMTFHNTVETDIEAGRKSRLIFKGEQSGGEESTLGMIQVSHDGTGDDQKGDIIFYTNDGSDGDAPTEQVRIDSAGWMGIGTSSPEALLHVSGGNLRLDNNRNLAMETAAGVARSMLQFDSSNNIIIGPPAGLYPIIFKPGNAEKMRLTPGGNLCLGTTAAGTSALGVLALSNSATAPVNSVDLCHLYCEDTAPGSAVLAIWQEAPVVPDTDETKFSHKMPVRINGATYFVMLIQP